MPAHEEAAGERAGRAATARAHRYRVRMEELAAYYRRWADVESAGLSRTYSDWAHGVASDPEVLALIEPLPKKKRQPNLVFAASRWLGAPVGTYEPWRDWLVAHWSEVLPEIMARRTQTNEAARCATLLPALARIPGPLALIEVGAAAGLCLLPDHYSYRYATGGDTVQLHPASGPSEVVLECEAPAEIVPDRVPHVAWRAGIDLDPIDPSDPEQAAWLETLVWPEHEDRRTRLRAALRLAASEPVPIIAGDLMERLPDLVKRVPHGLKPVVFHSAVMIYLDQDGRNAFRELVSQLPVRWISNEGAGLFPDWIERHGLDATDGRFVLALDGVPIARTGPHGSSYEPLPG